MQEMSDLKFLKFSPRQYFIVRTYSAGVFFGRIKSQIGNVLIMDDCQKIHYWEGAAAVEQLAIDGVSRPDKCRITIPVDSSVINQWVQILPCTEKSVECLKKVPLWVR